jgi:predicted RNA binding protein YcfA (HicA-like mRNA interferase family)
MPNRSIASVSQTDWIRACEKLGLTIDTSHGKGSHVLVKHPTNGTKYTIQRNLHRLINIKIFKKLIEWDFSEKQIWDAIN